MRWHIQVLKKCFPSILFETKDESIHLTFDDGPHPIATPIILQELKKRNIRATFFLLGQNAQKFPDLVRQIHTEGHQIGNHSFTHANPIFKNKAFLHDEIQRTREILEKIIDYPIARIDIVGPQGVETEKLIISMGLKKFMIMSSGVFMDWMKDPYMEQIWRIICIELYHNKKIKKFYSNFIENAFSFWKSNFEIMTKNNLIKPLDPEMLAREYLSFYQSAYMDYFIFRYDNTSASFLQEYRNNFDQHTEFIVNSVTIME